MKKHNERNLWRAISMYQLALIEFMQSEEKSLEGDYILEINKHKQSIIESAKIGDFSFSIALYLLKIGFKISCRDWNKTSMFIYIQNATTIKKEMARNEVLSKIEGDINIKSHIDLCDNNDIYVGWKPTTKDLFSERWILIEE